MGGRSLWFDDEQMFGSELARSGTSGLLAEVANAGGDVRSAIDSWVKAADADMDWRTEVEQRELRFAWNARGYTPMHGLLVLHFLAGNGPVHRKGIAAHVAQALRAMERDHSPGDQVMAYLKDRADCLLTRVCAKVIGSGADLLEAVGGVPMKFAEGRLSLAPGGSFGAAEAIRALADDPLGLFTLITSVEDGREEFDAVVRAEWELLRPGVCRAVLDLFVQEKGVTPAAVLKAFPQSRTAPEILDGILAELERRAPLHDGFSFGPDVSDWFRAAALCEGWKVGQLRRLLGLTRLLERQEDEGVAAFMAAAKVAVESLWEHARAEAVFGALTLLLHARFLKETKRRLACAEEEERCQAFVAALDSGEDILWLHRHCCDVPFWERGESRVWDRLPEGSKGHWRWMASHRLEGKPDLCAGFVEFILTWAPRDPYMDLEPLAVDLLNDAGLWDFVKSLEDSELRVAAIRAGAIRLNLDPLRGFS